MIGGSPCNELSLVNPARKGFSEGKPFMKITLTFKNGQWYKNKLHNSIQNAT